MATGAAVSARDDSDRLLRMIREWHRALVRIVNETDLLSAACRIVVEVGGFDMAMVVCPGNGVTQGLRCAAHFGPLDGRAETSLADASATWSHEGDGWWRASAAAIQTRRPYLLDEPVAAASPSPPPGGPWTGPAGAHCGFPLQIEGRCLGALTVRASERSAFDSAAVAVLDELGEGLAFGLGVRRKRSETKSSGPEAEEAEAYSALLFDRNPHPMWVLDVQTLAFLAVNDAAVGVYGYTRDEFLAKTILDLWPQDHAPLLSEDVVAVEEGIGDSGVWRHVRKDGRLLDVEVVAYRISYRGRPAELALVDDLTERRRTEAALMQSEINYRQLVENANSIILRWAPNGEITFINDFGLSFFGYSRDQLLGRHVVGTIVPPGSLDGQDLFQLMDEICLDPRRFEHNVNENMRSNGERVWVAWTNKAVVDEQGRVAELFSVGSDISERKLAEDRLAESEARYFSLFETAPDAIVILDQQTQSVLNVNQAACRLYGYSREEFMQLPPDEVPARVERIIPNGGSGDGGASVYARWERRKDGTVFFVEIETGFFEQGGRQAAVVFIRDVTEQKRAEEALRFTQFSVDHSSDAAYWMTGEGRLMYVNQAACEAVGYAREELLAMSVFDIDSGLASECWRAQWQELKEKRHLLFESEHRTRDGKVFPVEIRANFIEFAGKEYNCAHARDISEHKRAEAQLGKYREHLEELVAERTSDLLRANEDLRRAMAQLVQAETLAALGSLVAGVAHELNTPLGNSRVVASLLGEEMREFAAAFEGGSLRRSQVEGFVRRGREAVELLERNSARAADLIGQFKQVAVDQSSVRRRVFDLRQTVDEILFALRPTFKRTRHQIDVDIAFGLRLDSYPGPLEQVIANLIGNALAHGLVGKDPGRIQVQAYPVGADQVILRVSDNGVGIPANTLKRVFEPFFTTRLGQGGSGLGLYIVYNLVTGVLGGSIDVESLPEHGTTFIVLLPRSAPEASPAERAAPGVAGGDMVHRAGGA